MSGLGNQDDGSGGPFGSRGTLNLAESSTVNPPQPTVTDERLNAGVLLAQTLLVIAAGAIVLLLAYLAYMDRVGTSSVDEVVSKAMALAYSSSNAPEPKQIEALSQALAAAAATPPAAPTGAKLDAAKDVIDKLERDGIITRAQTTRLSECLTLAPNAPDKSARLDDCDFIFTTAKEIVATRGEQIDKLRLMKEFAKDAQDHHQAFRAFWLQAGQLILLNLLLPILTALLGYIFGTQQNGRS